MSAEEREELLGLFRGAPGDFKNLLLGAYGRLPAGWPADWVYRSAFGDEADARLASRREDSPLVITSYSIHYTKLYERGSRVRGAS